MKSETIPIIYARALVELAHEKGELQRVYEEVLQLERMQEDRTQRAFFESPRLERSLKKKVLEKALRGKLSDVVVNFILLVIDKGRQLYFLRMFEEFKALYYERIGLVHVTATTAVDLSQESTDALRRALEQKLKKKVELKNIVDQGALGGMIVRYDGMVADGSLRTALQKISAGMEEVKFGSRLVHED